MLSGLYVLHDARENHNGNKLFLLCVLEGGSKILDHILGICVSAVNKQCIMRILRWNINLLRHAIIKLPPKFKSPNCRSTCSLCLDAAGLLYVNQKCPYLQWWKSAENTIFSRPYILITFSENYSPAPNTVILYLGKFYTIQKWWKDGIDLFK